MATVIFVHGTGVRKPAYDQSFDKVRSALAGNPAVSIKPCYWGHLGSQLLAGGASVPTYDTRRALDSYDDAIVSNEDYRVNLWGVLYQDPLYELRALAIRQTGVTKKEWVPGQLQAGEQLGELGKSFQVSAELRGLLDRGGIAQEFEGARQWITSSRAYQSALQAAAGELEEYRQAIARALIAQAAAQAAEQDNPVEVTQNASLRDEIEGAIIRALGGGERGIGAWVRGQLSGMVCRLGSGYVGRHRGGLTDKGSPATGDILLYQTRGEEISGFIRQCVLQAPRPRVLLAHSLGGIACVDLLIAESIEVDLLITVGSQAPFLYEINSLRSLPYGKPLPAHVPRWINIYDLRDFLSYVGGKIFPGRVQDIKVDNRQPFPSSHSAYWSNEQVWTTIAKELP